MCYKTQSVVLQGKGRMTTYWLLGEKNPEANNEAVVVSSSSSGLGLEAASASSVPKQDQPEQLLSQQANAPSITRELVQDTTIKIEDEKQQKIEETTPLLQSSNSNNEVVVVSPATNAAGNGSTHPL